MHKAQEMIDSGIQLKSRLSVMYTMQSMILKQLDMPKQALNAIEKAQGHASGDLDSTVIYSCKGDIFLCLNQLDSAECYIKRSKDNDSYYSRADYENLRASLEKLQLNDASLTFSPESSVALGFGFRCGFLGLLHMEIIQERLDREFNMDVITTVPNVSYMVYDKQGNAKEVHNPSGLPDATMIDHIEEPYIRASIITTTNYIGPIMKLCLDKRGELINQEYVSGNRVELHFMLPLGEIVIDFYDKLKSISKGYASFDYHIDSFRPSKLAKLDILLNGEPVDALSTLAHHDNAVALGRRMCEKLKELIPRQQFDIAIQAAIGSKIVARETVKCVRKDVTAKCYGGDVSRKRKLLEKQKRGKKRMKQIGNVEVPQKAFLAVLKLD